MVHSDDSKRPKYKPRGRPFPKGNHKGKTGDSVLDASGRESGVGGDIVAPLPNKSIVGQKNGIVAENLEIKEGRLMRTDENKPVHYEQSPIPSDEEKTKEETPETRVVGVGASETVDSLTFSNGNDTLKIVLIKKHNRMFRLQMFLNENIEIRNNTFNGASQAYNYWDLLKNSLNKK